MWVPKLQQSIYVQLATVFQSSGVHLFDCTLIHLSLDNQVTQVQLASSWYVYNASSYACLTLCIHESCCLVNYDFSCLYIVYSEAMHHIHSMHVWCTKNLRTSQLIQLIKMKVWVGYNFCLLQLYSQLQIQILSSQLASYMDSSDDSHYEYSCSYGCKTTHSQLPD